MDATKELELTRHFASRLAVILRAYGQRMKRAEFAFTSYLNALSVEHRGFSWAEYERESHKADRLSLRHHRLARRALDATRG